jgi:hypothetical protein
MGERFTFILSFFGEIDPSLDKNLKKFGRGTGTEI